MIAAPRCAACGSTPPRYLEEDGSLVQAEGGWRYTGVSPEACEAICGDYIYYALSGTLVFAAPCARSPGCS